MSENEQINQSNETKNEEKPKKKGWLLWVILLLLFVIGLGVYYNDNPITPVMNEVTEDTVIEEVPEIAETIDEEVVTETTEEEIIEPFNVEDFDYTFKEFYRLARAKENAITRDLPDEIGHKLGVLEPLEEVVVTAQCNETGWYRIEKEGEIFYVDYNNLKFIFNKEIEYPEGYTENGWKIIEYTDTGFPIVGYTEEGKAIADYEKNGTPVIYFTPQKNNTHEVANNNSEVHQNNNAATSTNTSNNNSTNGSLPYIINGVDIRTGDWNGDGINDNNGNTWYEMQTWTASNGYTLKIADAYYVRPGALAAYDSVIRDGTESLAPDSDFSLAQAEYLGRTSLVTISPDNLPSVNTVSSKQTSINVNDPSLLAYKAAFDPLWKTQNKGSMSELVISSNSIGLLDATNGFYYMWDITYDASRGDWALRIIGSYTKLQWNAIKNAIRIITPDADSVFDVIYKACYGGYPGLECEKYGETDWITVGSTQLKGDWTTGTLYVRFK